MKKKQMGKNSGGLQSKRQSRDRPLKAFGLIDLSLF